MCITPFLIIGISIISVLYGTKEISIQTIWQAFIHFDANNPDHQVILTSRVPRAVAVLCVGGFLAVAGAIMQGITRNYLASPSLMGVNAVSYTHLTLPTMAVV